jgi:small subunit ribosomal protein S1
MSEKEDDFGAMLAAFEKENAAAPRRKDPKIGEMVKGRVVTIGHEAVFVDLGAKAEGMIDILEVRDADGKLLVKIGDTVEARVVETAGKAGCIVLRRAALGRGPEAKAELEQAFAHGIPVEGTVSAVNKGGVEVTIAGVRAFCPISQLDARHVEDATAYVGQKLQFKITRYEAGARGQLNLVVSRRQLVEEENARKAAETMARITPGAVVKGKITSLRDYGAFVDLGGVEGMLHVSELGFSRVNRPSDLLAVGQEVEVQVLKIEKSTDPKRSEPRIALSLKALEKDPWEDVAARFREGTKARGTVVRLDTFGAFVEIAPGIEGLVHISELGGEGKRQIRHPRDVVKVGQQVEVVVLGVDTEKHRISLSMNAATVDGDDPTPVPPAPQKLGTFGDLLAKAGSKKQKK